jgi:hypothetical protein
LSDCTLSVSGEFTSPFLSYHKVVAFTIPVYETGSARYCREQIGS